MSLDTLWQQLMAGIARLPPAEMREWSRHIEQGAEFVWDDADQKDADPDGGVD